MTRSKLWGGWHQIIGGDISPPSPPGFAPLLIKSKCVSVSKSVSEVVSVALLGRVERERERAKGELGKILRFN